MEKFHIMGSSNRLPIAKIIFSSHIGIVGEFTSKQSKKLIFAISNNPGLKSLNCTLLRTDLEVENPFCVKDLNRRVWSININVRIQLTMSIQTHSFGCIPIGSTKLLLRLSISGRD